MEPTEVGMPNDWDDHDGWERYYRARLTSQTARQYPEPEMALRFLPSFQAWGWRKVWFPGCGISAAPAIYAAHGFEVWASDLSESAVRWQLASAANVSAAAGDPSTAQFLEGTAPAPGGSLRVIRHDFREPFPEGDFAVTINDRAFQALPEASMRAAARVHHDALRPGGQGFFDTMNVQGGRRDRIEDALTAGGFHIPLGETERWYRAALAATGIPFLFILGHPRIPYVGEYANNAARHARDTAVLDGFASEYRRRGEAEAEATRHLFSDGRTRVAVVIYGTG